MTNEDYVRKLDSKGLAEHLLCPYMVEFDGPLECQNKGMKCTECILKWLKEQVIE